MGRKGEAMEAKSVEPLPSQITAAFNPSPSRRLLIILSFPFILLLGVPIWWRSTAVERLPLPTARIEALESAPLFDTRSSIFITADNDAFPTPPPGRAQATTQQILVRVADEVTKSVDGLLGQAPAATKKSRHWDLLVGKDKNYRSPLRVHILATDQANASWPLTAYVQPPSMGFERSSVRAGTLVVPIHPSQVGDVNLPTHLKMTVSNAIVALFPPYRTPASVPLRALKYAPNITLSFVVLNEDSTSGSYVQSWDVSSAIKEHVLPHLEPLRDVFRFNVESQILYHSPLTFEPLRSLGRVGQNVPTIGDESSHERLLNDSIKTGGSDQAWYIGEEEMKIFVNSESWSLDSGSTNNPVLRFMLYIPSSAHRPMRIAQPEAAQSFLLPQFGSVVLLNPPETAPQEGLHLNLAALQHPFHLFTQHLYSLLALPPIPPKITAPPPPSSRHPPNLLTQPLTPWQVEEIMRVRARENSLEARKTLAGIVRLVSKIKEMKVGKGVRDKVLGAVERLEKMDKTRESRQAFILSRDAVALASQAFFDPSMMGLLYFPDEHKFAVYTPLFAPIAVPLFVAVLRELIAWRKRRRVTTSLEPQNEDETSPKTLGPTEVTPHLDGAIEGEGDAGSDTRSVSTMPESPGRSRGGHNLRSRSSLRSPSVS